MWRINNNKRSAVHVLRRNAREKKKDLALSHQNLKKMNRPARVVFRWFAGRLMTSLTSVHCTSHTIFFHVEVNNVRTPTTQHIIVTKRPFAVCATCMLHCTVHSQEKESVREKEILVEVLIEQFLVGRN